MMFYVKKDPLVNPDQTWDLALRRITCASAKYRMYHFTFKHDGLTLLITCNRQNTQDRLLDRRR